MSTVDRNLEPIARARRGLITRAEIDAADDAIGRRVADGRWTRLHAGVYQVGVAPLAWRDQLVAAVLAAGDGSVVSHRAAVVLWGLDGIGSAPLELTVPITHRPLPRGVIVHRSRRPPPASLIDGIPVTSVERTILDAASCLPPLVVEKAMESAFRRWLTTPRKLLRFLDEVGGRGVRGTRVLRGLLAERPEGRPAGSAAEVELLRLLRMLKHAGVEDPVRQHEVELPDGSKATLDVAWPPVFRGIEVDGVDSHATAEALDYDDERQNLLFEVGWELRRYAARRIRREPKAVLASVLRFLRADPRA